MSPVRCLRPFLRPRTVSRRTATPFRPCLEPLEDRRVPVILGTTTTITDIHSLYTPLSQLEVVKVQVTSQPGVGVNQGQVTITDGGQTKTVGVFNGFAKAVFTFPLGNELPLQHTVGASFGVPPGQPVSFFPSSTAATAPDTFPFFLLQVTIDLAIASALLSS